MLVAVLGDVGGCDLCENPGLYGHMRAAVKAKEWLVIVAISTDLGNPKLIQSSRSHKS